MIFVAFPAVAIAIIIVVCILELITKFIKLIEMNIDDDNLNQSQGLSICFSINSEVIFKLLDKILQSQDLSISKMENR